MVVGALTLIGCGGQPVDAPRVTSDAGPVHVHGLGVNPADGALFVAAHTGLFRAPRGQLRARRVGDRFQDTMGFAVVGPDRFLGSGHPDLRERLPPFLGLIESRDAGRTWRALSLQGSVDFHVLEARGSRVYGYGSDFESRGERFLASRDGGRTWRRIEPPGPLLSLAIAPGNPDELIASTESSVHHSTTAGRTWAAVHAPAPGLLTWTADGIFLVSADGRVWRSPAGAASWRPAGSVGGGPAAFDGGVGAELLVALHDGTIKRSLDAGGSWTVRARPSG